MSSTLDPVKPSTIWQAALPWFAKNDRWRLPIGELGDQLVQSAIDALRLRYPGVTPHDGSLALLGKDRRIPRAPSETAEAYARRLNLWLDLWGLAGLPLGLLYAVQSFVFPGYPTVRLVERSGLWHTLNEGASRDLTPFEAMTVQSAGEARYVPIVGASVSPRAEFWLHQGSNWDWDSVSDPSRSSHVEDCWVVIDPPAYTFKDYTTTQTHSPNTCWGVDILPGTATLFRELCKIYRRAGSNVRAAIFVPSANYFTANATADSTYPDGTWSWTATTTAGASVPNRNLLLRYADIIP